MATPTREQVEAYLASLPPDQQGPALREIQQRMAVPTPQPTAYELAARGYGASGANPIIAADPGTKAMMAGGLAGVAAPMIAGAAIPALTAYPGAMAALGGGTAAAIEGAGPKGVLFGALTGGALTKVGKLWRVAKMMGLVGKPSAAAAGEAGALTQAEMQNVVKQLARGEEGAVLNPAVEEVAAKMVPRGELPPMSQGELLAIMRGASPKATPVSTVGKTMVPAGELPPMSQGEMTTVARGVGKPPSGWIENPSRKMVEKFMQRQVPAGVDPAAVEALQKWGMSFDDAVRLATKVESAGAATPAVSRVASAPASAPATAPAPAPATTTLTPEQLVLRIQQLTGNKATPEIEAYLATQPTNVAEELRVALARRQGRTATTVGGPFGPSIEEPPLLDLEALLRASLERR